MKYHSIELQLGIALLGIIFSQTVAAQSSSADEARDAMRVFAAAGRAQISDLSFEDFKRQTFKEPYENGKYIVDGDMAIADEKQLREFYEKLVATDTGDIDDTASPEFAIMTVGGLQAVWSTAQKRALTYCISDTFGPRYHQVVAEVQSAAAAWESVADLDFIHLMSEDGGCTADNPRVVFDVRPVQVSGRFLARAFFPNESRRDRNVLIDESSFQLDPNRRLQLVGILRHELGHTIGARHEHTRPEAGKCFEDDNWEPLTDYDPLSVMHYPQCNGLGDWSLTLTNSDKNGVACVYGAAAGFTIDPTVCNKPMTSTVSVLQFDNESVGSSKEKRYDTLQVKPNSQFVAVISGIGEMPGDPDLYVKFDGTPHVGLEYDCRPFLTGAQERCEMDVPSGASIARVMVHGYAQGNYKLKISYVKP